MCNCLKQSIIFGCVIFCACTTTPPPEIELEHARSALHGAQMAGAEELAPDTYLQAQNLLSNAEQLISKHEYTDSIPLLTEATALAQASEKQAASEMSKRLEAAPPPVVVLQPQGNDSPPYPTPTFSTKTRHLPPITTYTVQEGDNLWSIAAHSEVYGDPLLWPLLYQANRDQIKDPRQIYTGQSLTIQRNLSDAEREDARNKARKSDVFPIDQMPRILH